MIFSQIYAMFETGEIFRLTWALPAENENSLSSDEANGLRRAQH